MPSRLSLTESKTKDLVPLVDGNPLHSLHNPRREAEVWANNHLAQIQRSPAVLVLGLGFGYHLEELAKILRLKHKNYRLHAVEALPEVARLWASYRTNEAGIHVHTSATAAALWEDEVLCRLLLEKPAVIIHRPSWETDTTFYRAFLAKRAPRALEEWRHADPAWASFLVSQGDASLARATRELPSSQKAAWLRAYWEGMHAE